MDDKWNLVISNFQEIYKCNNSLKFDEIADFNGVDFDLIDDKTLSDYSENVANHLDNITKSKNLLKILKDNLEQLIDSKQSHPSDEKIEMPTPTGKGPMPIEKINQEVIKNETVEDIENIKEKSKHDQLREEKDLKQPQIIGRSYWISQFNSCGEIRIGSNVAYKPKKSIDGEWFHCEVIKISPDGLRFEVRDPEPDEFGNTGKIFKCSWKDVQLIPPENATRQNMINYPPNTKVLARYPETTTFYPAVVIGNKRDGTCRLKFDGEEEVDKETEVPRRFVLPFPTVSAKPLK
ncbi:hypothetical protein Kpol_1048p69 [Vanderwaltozyma polyspora DSM 70294]|uniref:SGF29 C-terminal domain-containing protein n=1 Tax=Vanderwaltozyma polyspora (strain ATCC 22028 / DSM 70294 / BCRC 21397 / CBS 2163 / NBRC 10782 / NRRL Y-8283 / UCD 57-17) TaxID=436907 RepID=A7TGN1_VANPO|nr:uncharacterized protein Kpol_1048p69 [Vanderwaltozyma polyspora DSM 70294]EDO18638.1 hypothetical protein Kpol_1048p69 [Vanderwaltozyma polyspora DSM 70294]